MAERRSSVGRGSLSKPQPPPSTLAVSATELQIAFAFFDRHSRGYITADDLRARLAPLYPQLTDKDFHTMTQHKTQLTAADLAQLLTIDPQPPHSTATDARTSTSTSTASAKRQHAAQQPPQPQQHAAGPPDVLLEAFQLFDPHNRGYVDTEHLMTVLMGLGVAEVTRGDVELLVEQNDRDKDGKIGLNDFKRMVGSHHIPNNSGKTAPTV